MAQQGVIIPQTSTATFPGCALSCSTLLQAQTICMPPNVAAANQLTYDQCFCNSAFLTPFATTTDGVCIQECTLLGDRQLLQAWYNNFCGQVRQGIDPTTQTTPAGTVPTVVTTTASITSGTLVATATPTGTGSSSGSNTGAASSNHPQTWIEGHWKYVMMLGILAVGLALLAWFAVWWKRRHARKLESQRAAASGFTYDPEKRPANDPRRSATPDLWGPHQMMQATQGYGYTTDIVPEDKGTRKSQQYRGTATSRRVNEDSIEVAEVDRRVSSRPSNRRARPSELETNARMIGAADRSSKKRGRSRGQDQARTEKDLEANLPARSNSRPRTERDPEKT